MDAKEKAKLARQNKVRFETHVNIIMLNEGAAKADAQALAYQEGPIAGLSRMGLNPSADPAPKK